MLTSCIQIAGDPTKWWLAQQIQASQLTGQPLSVISMAPIQGLLVLSPRTASVAIFDVPSEPLPQPLGIPGGIIYVPTAAGPSAGHVGYELPGTVDPQNLASQIATLMHDGHSQTITLGGAGGTLVLNGATLSFAVLAPAAIGDSSGHG